MSTEVDWRKEEHRETCLAGLGEALLFMRRLPTNSGIEEPCFVSIVGLLQAATYACRQLQAGWRERDLPMLAWSSRNALEVMIWTKYVTSNALNAKRFYLDWLNDAEETLTKSIALDQFTGADHKTDGVYRDLFKYDPSVQLKARTHLDNLRRKHTAPAQKRLDIARVAQEVGEGMRFKNLNPLMSKFLHATAYSVLSIPSRVSHERKAALMLDAGFWSLMNVIGTTNDFLVARQLGSFLTSAKES